MSWVEGKEIFVEIYGESFGDEFDEIRLSSEQVRTIYPSGDVEVEVDETKKPAAGEMALSGNPISITIKMARKSARNLLPHPSIRQCAARLS